MQDLSEKDRLFRQDQLEDRVAARRQEERRYKKKATVRVRIFCKRCNKGIPEEKRSHAVFCSDKCKNRHGWAERQKLEREIRLAVRAGKTIEHCDCGAELNTTIRPGPVQKSCRKCRDRESHRRRRAREKERKAS